jgi:hypothetical protein
MKRLSNRYLLPLLAIAAILLFPPWAQDDPVAPMAEYRGTKFSRGHSFVLSRPAPAVAPDYRIYAPPVTVPVEIDRTEWLREVITVLVVSSLIAMLGDRSAFNLKLSGYSPFGGRTFVLAMLVALVIPNPILGPVAFQPVWLLTDSNHGVSGWLMVFVIWAIMTSAAYFALGLLATLLRRVFPLSPHVPSRVPA